MKKVYICSPCRGDYENNIQRAKEFSRAAVECGCIPVTPHIYLTQFMDDTIPAERELGLSIGRELVLMCDELWAFGLDCPTAGMAAEIELARERGIPVHNGYERITGTGGETADDGQKDEKPEIGSVTLHLPAFNHHRASDDAAMVAYMLIPFFEKLERELGIRRLQDINPQMLKLRPQGSKSSRFPKHIIILAKNKMGLKHL